MKVCCTKTSTMLTSHYHFHSGNHERLATCYLTSLTHQSFNWVSCMKGMMILKNEKRPSILSGSLVNPKIWSNFTSRLMIRHPLIIAFFLIYSLILYESKLLILLLLYGCFFSPPHPHPPLSLSLFGDSLLNRSVNSSVMCNDISSFCLDMKPVMIWFPE